MMLLCNRRPLCHGDDWVAISTHAPLRAGATKQELTYKLLTEFQPTPPA